MRLRRGDVHFGHLRRWVHGLLQITLRQPASRPGAMGIGSGGRRKVTVIGSSVTWVVCIGLAVAATVRPGQMPDSVVYWALGANSLIGVVWFLWCLSHPTHP